MPAGASPLPNATVLVVNCGSSSLKLALFGRDFTVRARVHAERLGTAQASAVLTAGGTERAMTLAAHADHRQALGALIEQLRSARILNEEQPAIAHRVVHGGEQFQHASIIDGAVLAAIESCTELAPLHNPLNLAGIRECQQLFPHSAQVAVFDTAFHHTLPEHAYLYAIPRRYYEQWGVRRYGFHGTSHAFMLHSLSSRLQKPAASVSLISAHLGNGCSITAIERGCSRDTSMGLTPLEGLVMGSRSGDVDPGLFDFCRQRGLSVEAVSAMLNRESGLLGLSGLSNDMRTLVAAREAGNQAASTAIDVFCFRLARYIGAMMASLSQLDGLVFTGGIGQHSALVRECTLSHLALLGFSLDAGHNRDHGQRCGGRIDDGRGHPIYVIATDEEQMIARDAIGILATAPATTES